MATRRSILGFIGLNLPVWALARGPGPLSALVSLSDPSIEVIENLYIPMRDGTRLAARLFIPASARAHPAGAVLEYLPYRKRDGYRYRDDVVGPFLAKAGIAFIRVDIRGTGESDGAMIDEYLPIEQEDALAVIDWIAHQAWCNGHVGMRGISYGSFTALQAAAKAPAALKAIVSTCGTEQRYLDDIHYRGGCLINDQFTWAMEWQVVMRAPPTRPSWERTGGAPCGSRDWRRVVRSPSIGPYTRRWMRNGNTARFRTTARFAAPSTTWRACSIRICHRPLE
jgi:predicted acyl esterase